MRKIIRTIEFWGINIHYLSSLALVISLGFSTNLQAETTTENAAQTETPVSDEASPSSAEQSTAAENKTPEAVPEPSTADTTATTPEAPEAESSAPTTTDTTEPTAPVSTETSTADETGQPSVEESKAKSSEQAQPTAATDIPEKGPVKKLKKFEVTGSHIKRVDIEGYSPVLTISKEEIEQSGFSTLSDLLRNHPLENGISFNENIAQWNSTSPGGSPISLRGFGVDSTLVLINGRRFAPYAFAHGGSESFVDLNSIPLGAIERIEILKDGASAIYGSDAITGVVNIILQKDYSGTEATLMVGKSDYGDGEEMSLNAITGRAVGNGNYTFTFDYFRRDDVNRIDRPFSESADHTAQGGSDYRSQSTYPPYIISATTFADLQGTGTGDEKYDFNKDATLIPDSERMGATFSANWDLNSNLNLFTEVLLNRTTTKSQYAPVNFYHLDYVDYCTPLFGVSCGTNIVAPVSAAHPNNPFGEDVYVFWRMTEIGNRHSETVTDASRLVVGLEGLAGNWDWNSAIFFTRSESEFTEDNNVNLTAFANALAAGTLNPFVPTNNSQAVLDSIRATQTRKGTSDLYGVDAKGTTDIAELDAGPVTMAIGLDARHESLDDHFDSLTEQGLLVGKGGTSTDDSRDISSAFAEFSIPLLEDLELQLAGRFENYSDFGSTANPKVALRYQPNKRVLLRTSWGKGFRAPSLIQLNGSLTGQAILLDTTRCNDVGLCIPAGYNVNLSGNPDLDPTTSEAVYLGGVFEPINNVTLAVDYWKYKREDVIRQSFQFTVDHEADFPGRVVRGAPEFPGDPGPIILINDSFTNIAEEEISGLDVDFKVIDKNAEFGNVVLQAFFTRIFTFDSRAFPGEPIEDKKAAYHYPNFRNVINIGWGKQDFGFILSRNYVSDYEGVSGIGRVSSQITYDLQFNYTGLKSGKITVGIENLTDEEPPFANEEEGFDPAIHNPMGRFYYARYNHKF